ncbi:MAG: SUMF1/EgtB/PvdO family nonheme iron enzyme [Verrucomicrobiota bacterium]
MIRINPPNPGISTTARPRGLILLVGLALLAASAASSQSSGDKVAEQSPVSRDQQQAVPAGFAWIPGGEFTQGDPLDGDMEAAPHAVRVSAFHMQQKEVTKAEWDAVRDWGLKHGFTDLNRCGGKAADHPLQRVTWYGAVKWCNARSEMEGRTPCYYMDAAQTLPYRIGDVDLANPMVKWDANGYRLPTEAEWEKAARGGLSGKRFPWGDSISHAQANYKSNAFYPFDVSPTRGEHPAYDDGDKPYTSPVGSFAASGYGLYDMVGNVCEWCWDWSRTYPVTAQTDPRGPDKGTDRVTRGDSWSYHAWNARCAARSSYSPGDSYFDLGFRTVISAVP